MLNKNKRSKVFARRAFILAGFKSFFVFGLVSRLYYLQIMQSDKYKTYSDSNRVRPFIIPPERGEIVDREGRSLAVNRNYFRVFFDKRTKSDLNKSINNLSNLLKLDYQTKENLIDKIKKHKRVKEPVLLIKHAKWDQVAIIEANSAKLQGISVNMGQIRHYPMGEISPHLIGYLGYIKKNEINNNPLLKQPDFKIGKTGVERYHENYLRGLAGVKQMEVDAFGTPVRELSRKNSIPGKDLELSFDQELHELISVTLAGKSGSVVVMDVNNGEVVSMFSSPAFDPNLFTYGLSSNTWNTLLNDYEKPLINKSVANQYPPGSTFKALVALALLKEGIDPEKEVYCPGFFDLGRRRFHCWKRYGHGKLNMHEAISHSCNVYFYTAAKKIGLAPILEVARKFGLGSSLGIELPNEKSGILPDNNWKQKRFGSTWRHGDTLNLSIGQGFLLATPLQLAVMTARIATGRQVQPTLIKTGVKKRNFAKMDTLKWHFSYIRKGMYDVINDKEGTAYSSRIENPAYNMAGKTGTSQVISKKKLLSMGDNLTDEEKRKTQNHALFVGYAPFNKPRYCVSVIIEHGGGGSTAAAPVAKDVLTLTMSRFKNR